MKQNEKKLRPLLQPQSPALKAHCAPLCAILSSELLRSPPELLLQRDVPRALHWGHEPREILLLCLHDGDALLLQLQGSVEKIADVLLVRLAWGRHLETELAPRLALLCRKLIELRTEPRVGLFQLGHLRVAQSDPLLRQPGNAFPKLLLERRAVRLRVASTHRLTESGSCAQTECQHR